VKPRDRLGPLSFTLTVQVPHQRTATAHPATQIIACCDDINVVDPAASADPAFETLATEMRTVGTTPVNSKSAAYSPDRDMAAATAIELGILHAHAGLVVARTPIVHEFLLRNRQHVHDELQRLSDLLHPLTCLDKWVISTDSLQLRHQHLSRTVPAAIATPHLEEHPDDLLCAAFHVIGQPDP
jgi:hypothetical protein